MTTFDYSTRISRIAGIRHDVNRSKNWPEEGFSYSKGERHDAIGYNLFVGVLYILYKLYVIEDMAI
jgi:hypothetical protein